MPVMHFRVRWPDQSETNCYSPSTVVSEFFTPDTQYALDDFVERARRALGIASDRVREKYGFACSAAMDELARIEARAERFSPQGDVTVTVIELI